MEQSPNSIKTRFQNGNELWRLAPQTKPFFANGDELWAACVDYFEWASGNPLMEMKAFSVNGEIQTEVLPKLRAMSIRALSVFLGINRETWYEWRNNRADLKEAIEKIEDVIFTQKFEGASAGLLVSNIIMRDLGLADKQEVTGRDGGPIEQSVSIDPRKLSDAALAELLAAKLTDETSDLEGSGLARD